MSHARLLWTLSVDGTSPVRIRIARTRQAHSLTSLNTPPTYTCRTDGQEADAPRRGVVQQGHVGFEAGNSEVERQKQHGHDILYQFHDAHVQAVWTDQVYVRKLSVRSQKFSQYREKLPKRKFRGRCKTF